MSLSCTVTEIFSVKYWHDFEKWVRVRKRSLNMAQIVSIAVLTRDENG